MGLIFLSHVLLAYWAWAAFARDGHVQDSMAQFFPALLVADAFPFIVWAVIANRVLVDLISNIIPKTKTSGGRSGD
jgi:hypothetical protein